MRPSMTHGGCLSPQYSTVVTPHAREYVHHMLIYLCPTGEQDREVNAGNCEAERAGGHTDISLETEKCRSGQLIAAWAIGGEVN